MCSFDVRVFTIRRRPGRRAFEVRWPAGTGPGRPRPGRWPLAWAERASLPVSRLADPQVTRPAGAIS
jgi:hypothetical protein